MKLYAIFHSETGEHFQEPRLFTRPGDATSAFNAQHSHREDYSGPRGDPRTRWVRGNFKAQTAWQLREVQIVPLETP